MEVINVIKISKYMTLEGITFKKTDLKRLEKYESGTILYVVVAGRKDPICIKSDDIEEIRQGILNQIEE